MTRRHRAALALALALAGLGGCGDDDGSVDAGRDAGAADAGRDAGPPDAGGPSYLFGPCTRDDQCPGPDGFCRESTMEGWHGGFCTRPCVPPDRGLCDDGVIFNHCVEQEDGSGICEQRCENGVDCMRTGYTCQGLGAFPGGTGLAIAMVVGALIVLPAGVIQANGALTQPDLLGAALVVAILSSVLPYSLDLEALRRLPAAVFGVLMSLDPAIAAVVGFLVLGQALGVREVIAIAMVVVASAGSAALSHREEPIGTPADP